MIKQALPESDPLRLRYRNALIAVVSGIVRSGFANHHAIPQCGRWPARPLPLKI